MHMFRRRPGRVKCPPARCARSWNDPAGASAASSTAGPQRLTSGGKAYGCPARHSAPRSRPLSGQEFSDDGQRPRLCSRAGRAARARSRAEASSWRRSETVSSDPEAVRPTVVPLDEDLQLVRVFDGSADRDARLGALDPLSPLRNPDARARKARHAAVAGSDLAALLVVERPVQSSTTKKWSAAATTFFPAKCSGTTIKRPGRLRYASAPKGMIAWHPGRPHSHAAVSWSERAGGALRPGRRDRACPRRPPGRPISAPRRSASASTPVGCSRQRA
jgi:hypothetical protein